MIEMLCVVVSAPVVVWLGRSIADRIADALGW